MFVPFFSSSMQLWKQKVVEEIREGGLLDLNRDSIFYCYLFRNSNIFNLHLLSIQDVLSTFLKAMGKNMRVIIKESNNLVMETNKFSSSWSVIHAG